MRRRRYTQISVEVVCGCRVCVQAWCVCCAGLLLCGSVCIRRDDPRAYTAPRVRGAPCRGDSHEKQCAQPRVAACYSKLVNHPAE